MSGKGKTLKDLAARLDISVATVSRALAGNDRIAAATRERVAEAAREIGYVPNRAARALVSGRSGFVGLVLPVRGHGVEDMFLGQFVSGLGSGLARHGMDLFLAAVPEGRTELSVIEHLVEGRRADALVLARTTEDDPRVAYLARRGFPFVAHGRVMDEGLPYAWTDTDGEAAFAEAFELLYGLGHRRFGFVTITEPMTFRRLRAAGLTRAVARRGDPAATLMTVASPRFDRDRRAAEVRRLLDRPDRPTAVLGLFDGIALTVLEEAARLGLAVPGDLSVIGFDDIPGAAVAPPGLTTFDASIHDCADGIADMVARALAAPDAPPETRLVRPRLVARGSHGPAPER
jgi:LacI family transcriptional regulator